MPRWFSQRVGWYHGLIKVYIERFSEVLRVSRPPFASYHYLFYLGGLSICGAPDQGGECGRAAAEPRLRRRQSLLRRVLPSSRLTNPAYFAAALSSYLALGVIALFTSVPKSERAYAAPIVPLYLFYALVHIAPMTVGYANYFALRLLPAPVSGSL